MNVVLLTVVLLTAAPQAPLLDGDGAEHPLGVDDRADGGLLELRARLDDGLWIGLEFADEIEADSGSGLVLHLDADADPDTGDDEGCDLVFDLQARHGFLHPERPLPGSGRLHERLGLVVVPTFASARAELYLPRRDLVGDRARFYVVHGNDRVPDSGFVEVEHAAPVAIPPLGLEKSGALRIAAWNVERDGFFDPARRDALRRLLAAIDPDVLVVMEVFDHTDRETLERSSILGLHLPYAAKADPGNVVISRHPIDSAWSVIDPADRRNGHRVSAAVLDTPDGPFMVMPAHWRCCAKEGERLFEADATVGFLRDAFTAGGNFSLDSELPFVVCGDLNLVTTRRPLDVLLSGIVVDKDSFAPDFPAGPGRTPLEPVPLRHSHAPFEFTWRPQGGKYYAGRLDWVIRPTSVTVTGGFVLDTATMPPEVLHAHGLRAQDSATASDHAPVVVDVDW